ncbi:hypothetical protein Pdw03_8178 [Penicillium digitatum]|uniref:Uncharacterized protein n=1 Tax=Penicillium digitatum TaxID=36651 RepID=A0A7T6XNC3_PENDI|nr:hypothetical protein Pdw03_8178 [Penicillium digitatum]
MGDSGYEGVDSCCAVASGGSAKPTGNPRDLPLASADAILYSILESEASFSKILAKWRRASDIIMGR